MTLKEEEDGTTTRLESIYANELRCCCCCRGLFIISKRITTAAAAERRTCRFKQSDRLLELFHLVVVVVSWYDEGDDEEKKTISKPLLSLLFVISLKCRYATAQHTNDERRTTNVFFYATAVDEKGSRE